MAVMKKKGGKNTPAISTASLPDVIFMILFFFMVSTSMREVDIRVKYELPFASEAQKLEKKSLVSYIQIGPPILSLQAQYGTAPRIQLNDSFREPYEIGPFVASEKEKLSENERLQMTVSIRADRNVRMGIITDVKQELRRAEARKVSYSTRAEN